MKQIQRYLERDSEFCFEKILMEMTIRKLFSF